MWSAADDTILELFSEYIIYKTHWITKDECKTKKTMENIFIRLKRVQRFLDYNWFLFWKWIWTMIFFFLSSGFSQFTFSFSLIFECDNWMSRIICLSFVVIIILFSLIPFHFLSSLGKILFHFIFFFNFLSNPFFYQVAINKYVYWNF